MSLLEIFSLFLLGFSSLFPLVNPIGTALIINHYFAHGTLEARKTYARKVVIYCFILGISTLFLGSFCLKLMGISISTTQMAGGLIIAHMGLNLLNSEVEPTTPTSNENITSSLFYPIAFPLTLGPGGISALITLGAHAYSQELTKTLIHMCVLSVSLVAVLFLTYFCFAYSNVVIKRIGSAGSLALNRLMAFLVFCVGIQMFVSGLTHSFPKLFG